MGNMIEARSMCPGSICPGHSQKYTQTLASVNELPVNIGTSTVLRQL